MKNSLISCLAILAISVTLTACGNNAETVTETSAKISETTTAAETTASTAVTTEETVPLTSLEKANEWADEYSSRFLYDITGDGFPEMFEMSAGRVIWRFNTVWDYIYTDGGIYVCRDTDGRIFLAALYTFDEEMAGADGVVAARYDFYSNCAVETVLGNAEIFFTPYGRLSEGEEYKYYTAEYEFLGDCSERAELINSPREEVIDRFKKRFAEYILGCEVIDEIVYDYKDGSVQFGADTDFAVEPSDSLPEYETAEMALGDTPKSIDGRFVRINDETLESGFAFDTLNKFERLENIEFGWLSDNYDEKIKIPKGDWQGRVKKIRININDWDTSGFSDFANVERVIIDGHGIGRADLEFLKEMPSVRYIYAYFTADSAEAFIPLSEMPNLEAIIDSGHGSCMEMLINEEKQRVKELLPEEKYFWGMVK